MGTQETNTEYFQGAELGGGAVGRRFRTYRLLFHTKQKKPYTWFCCSAARTAVCLLVDALLLPWFTRSFVTCHSLTHTTPNPTPHLTLTTPHSLHSPFQLFIYLFQFLQLTCFLFLPDLKCPWGSKSSCFSSSWCCALSSEEPGLLGWCWLPSAVSRSSPGNPRARVEPTGFLWALAGRPPALKDWVVLILPDPWAPIIQPETDRTPGICWGISGGQGKRPLCNWTSSTVSGRDLVLVSFKLSVSRHPAGQCLVFRKSCCKRKTANLGPAPLNHFLGGMS